MAHKLKIILAGPCRSGKTLLANFLADATESPSEEYRPTHVVRILEFESNINVQGRFLKIDIELWDSSGNATFKNCWPAVAWEAHGIIFIYNPEEDQQGRELELFYDHFVGQNSVQSPIPENQCAVFANLKGKDRGPARKQKLATKFNRIPQMEVNMEADGARLRSDFNGFLATLIENLTERHEQEEMNIMNMRA